MVLIYSQSLSNEKPQFWCPKILALPPWRFSYGPHILKGFIIMPYTIHETCFKPRLQVTIKVHQGMNSTTSINPQIHTLPNLDKFPSHVLAWTTWIIIHIAHQIFMLGAQSYKCLFIWYELTCVWERTFLHINNSIWILCAKWK